MVVDQSLVADLDRSSLCILGTCATLPEDDCGTLQTIVLIGPLEPAFWATFQDSSEYSDGAPDPMDRWSQRTIDAIAKRHNARAVYPFGGPPFLPFFTWAVRTGRFWPSPIGFLVHDTVGLFASFRGALVLPDSVPDDTRDNPCLTCKDQPCQTACPVDAFNDGYDVAACKSHLTASAGGNCLSNGCLARRACPIGRARRLPAQSAFHMKAFL